MNTDINEQALSNMKKAGVEIEKTPAKNQSQEAQTEKTHPWREITTQQTREAISGTALEPIVQYLEAVADPPLPLQTTLPKALVLVGCALSEKAVATDPSPDNGDQDKKRGVDLARLKIMTAGGQVCNMWCMLVGESGVGKDIGGRIHDLAAHFGWHIGSSGSAEGLADQYTETGNGFLAIPELGNYLDRTHWQHKATPFLTYAFSQGWFKQNLSTRNGGCREAFYCYPNVLTNVQPEVLAAKADKLIVKSGFLARFLISWVPRKEWRPSTGEDGDLREAAVQALEACRLKKGKVIPPEKYLDAARRTFIDCDAPLRAHWQRLINEYGPRLALMLSVKPGDTGEEVSISRSDWDGAALLVQWFYAMAERALNLVEDDAKAAKLEKNLARMYRYIRKHGPVTQSDISHNLSRGTTARDRNIHRNELLDRGLIRMDGKSTPGFSITKKSPPPGWVD